MNQMNRCNTYLADKYEKIRCQKEINHPGKHYRKMDEWTW